MKRRLLLSAAGSIVTFLKLFVSNKLHLNKEKLGKTYQLSVHGKYSVFRETVNDPTFPGQMIVLVVGFRLRLIGSNTFFHWIFQRVCILTTPFWSGFRGFHIKLWMVDKTTKNYAGIYEWYGKENAQRYLDVLLPVLRFFSVSSSVWYYSYEDRSLEVSLASLESSQR